MKDTLPPAEVRRIRELFGLTQEGFADLLGLVGSNRERTVRRYEGGQIPVYGARKAQIELLRDKREKRR